MAFKLRLAPPLKSALLSALVQQLVVLLLVFNTRNAEELAQVSLFAFLSFWGGLSGLVIRRGMSPTRIDLLVTTYGYAPLCVLTLYLSRAIWHWRGF